MKKMAWIGLLVWVSGVWGDSLGDFLEHMQHIKTMQAHFTQAVSAHGRLVSTSSGEMALAKPNQFLWKTNKPMPQRVVADGQRLWVYDVDLEQVTVRKLELEPNSSMNILLNTNAAELVKTFYITSVGPSQFELRAKSAQAD
ncbi:MAG: outer membrane lipoprotein carrier protein LolA, partial [Legionella sp. 21-45-4]